MKHAHSSHTDTSCGYITFKYFLSLYSLCIHLFICEKSCLKCYFHLQKPKIENLVTELQFKLQQIESKKEENSMIGHCTSSSASSPSGSGNQKLYKSLKKIKRHHSSENPTKNYYLAFPALNGKNKATMVQDPSEAMGEKPSAWLSLTKNKQQTIEQQHVENAQKCSQPRASKHKRFDKKENRRLQKANGALNDVQLVIKSNNNSNTFSPKKMQKTKNGANNSVNTNQKAKSQRYGE